MDLCVRTGNVNRMVFGLCHKNIFYRFKQFYFLVGRLKPLWSPSLNVPFLEEAIFVGIYVLFDNTERMFHTPYLWLPMLYYNPTVTENDSNLFCIYGFPARLNVPFPTCLPTGPGVFRCQPHSLRHSMKNPSRCPVVLWRNPGWTSCGTL